MAPAHGRVFGPAEDAPGRDQVVVLSDQLWRRQFGGDPSIIGREISLNQRPYVVLGIMPAAFDWSAGREELWVPIAFSAERRNNRGNHTLAVYGRLKDGVPLQQAAAETAMILEKRLARWPDESRERTLHVRPRDGAVRRRLSPASVRAARGCRTGAADRLRQRVQPVAGARHVTCPRARPPQRARCRTRTAGPTTVHRERRAGRHRSGRGGRPGGLVHSAAALLQSPGGPEAGAGDARWLRPGVRGRARIHVQRALRPGAGLACVPDGRKQYAQGRQPRRRPARRQGRGPLHADRRRSRAGAGAARWRRSPDQDIAGDTAGASRVRARGSCSPAGCC